METVVPLYASNPSLLPTGMRLNGIFEIEKLIGEGGMGQVYRARALEAQDIVAVKVIKAEVARDQSLMGLLRKEASTLSRISHEAIVKHLLFSLDPQLGRPYLVMEYVEGPSLADLIDDGPMSVEAVMILLNRIGAGLDAAHRLGITHRDISPDNIILPRSDPGRAKLIDFGIARDHHGNETIIADRFAGKFKFASPEHLGLHGGKVNPKSDIYSFGLTLAAALIGAPLDLGGTQVEMLRCRQTVPDLSKVDPRIRKILARMLQPEPVDRPDTIAELTVQEAGSVVLPRPADPARAAARRRGAFLAAGLALAGVAGLAGWYGMSRSGDPQPAAGSRPDATPSLSVDRDRLASSKSLETGRSADPLPKQKPQSEERAALPPVRSDERPTDAAAQRDVPRDRDISEPVLPPPPAEIPAPAVQDNPVKPVRQAEAPAPAPAPVPAAPPAVDVAPDQGLNIGRNRRDCSACPPLVEVPSGMFSMGSVGDPSEKPVHPVHIRGFLIGRGPVTVAEWNACQAAGACEIRAEGTPDQAVTNLSWDDAQQYVRWLSTVTRKAYRLPSEAEWEYATRGGTHTRFWWGDHFQSNMAPCRSGGSPSPDSPPAVAAFPENPFGLTGTTCVVAQWVSDCWHKSYRGAPGDGSAWNAPNCKQRVLRGGTWRSRAEAEHVTSRDFYDPAVRYPGNGLRVARDF